MCWGDTVNDTFSNLPPDRIRFSGRSPRRLALLFLLAGAVIAIILVGVSTAGMTGNQTPSREMWAIFTIASITLIGCSITLSAAPDPSVPQSARLIYVLLAGIILLALILRLYQLDTLPVGLWFDEAATGLIARDIGNNPETQPVYRHAVTYYPLWLHQIGVLLLGEASIAGLRLASVFFGVWAVYLGFLVGRELHDDWFGLSMAFFLAVPFWSLNFSRIAMTGIDAIAATLLIAYYLLRTLRLGSWRYVILLGTSVAVGLWLYAAVRVSVAALLIYALLVLRGRAFQPYWIRRAIVIAGIAVLLLAPLIGFIIAQPDAYLQRSREVSIFAEGMLQGRPLPDVFLENVRAYVELLYFHGDANGRHSVPNQPILDPVMVVLMGMGLLLSIVRRHSLMFIILLAASILTGALTIPSEAPNALRAIVALVPVAYFCAVTLHTLRRIPYPWLRYLVTGIPLILVLVLNVNTYFVTFARHPDSFMAFSTDETVRGKTIAGYQDAGYEVQLPRRQLYSAIYRFIMPHYLSQIEIISEEMQPFPSRLDRPVALILDPVENQWFATALQELYAETELKTIRPTDYGVNDTREIFHVLELDLVTTNRSVAPAPDYTLFVRNSGDYQFDPTGGSIRIDGQQVFDTLTILRLPIGYHRMETDLPLDELRWKYTTSGEWEPVPSDDLLRAASFAGHGLYGRIFKDGELILERLDPTLFSYFHLIPAERPYEVIWTATVLVPESGSYDFQLNALGDIEIRIDDELLFDGQDIRTEQSIELVPGRLYRLEVRYIDNRNASYVYLKWRLPDTEGFVPIPPQNLTPLF